MSCSSSGGQIVLIQHLVSSLSVCDCPVHRLRKNCSFLTLIVLTWSIWCAPNNANKRQMGFNSAFKGLTHIYIISYEWKFSCLYRVSQEECARLWEGVPYVKVYQYNPKHLCPKLNSYGDNGQRKVWSSGGSTHCTCQLTSLIDVYP